MSLDIAIDTALKRGTSSVMISRVLGVSMAAIEKRRAIYEMRREFMAQGRETMKKRAHAKNGAYKHKCVITGRPFALLDSERDRRVSDEKAVKEFVERGLSFRLRFEDDPRSLPWNAGAAARNDAALRARRAYHSTLGGVVDYSAKPEPF